MTWAALSVLAAFLQNLRSAVQKRLTSRLSTRAATATRFLYGLPCGTLWLAAVAGALGEPWPVPDLRFALFATGGAAAQIAATAFLLATFSRGSFAAGTTYSKTEGIQTVAFGYLVLGDRVSPGGLLGVVLSVLGVLTVSRTPSARSGARAASASGERTARWQALALGLGAGALFAVSAVGYRGASLALGDGHFLLRSACTLVFALAVQSLASVLWLRLAEPGALTRVARAWRPGVLAGLAGAGASAGWFAAFTLVDAAYVKAVGSIELVFAVLSAWLLFRETPSATELAGVALVMAGVIVTVTMR